MSTSTIQTLTYRFTLNAFKNGVQRILQGWQTGENLTRTLEISLMNNGEPYELPEQGVTANMYVKRPSQTDPSINACTIDFENNKIIYEVLPTDITEAGIVSMQLKIFDGTKILISPLFGMEVWESQASSSQASSTPQYTALEEALADAQAYSEKAIQQVYIDDDTNIFTIVFADGTTYESSAFADAIAEVGQYPLIAEGYACGTQDGEPVEEGSPYYHNNAEYYADQAGNSASNASTSELAAYASEQAAALSETSAEAYKDLSKSYAVGDTGKRTGEDVDNAKYYKERCEQIAASIEGGFIPMGTVTFATLPNLADIEAGWMYDVSDSFTSDSRFNDGGGKSYPAGSNVYATAQSKWDVLSGETPTINGKTGSSITLDGRDLLLTGYDKPSAYTPITTLDTINSAIGKLEVRISGLLPHVIVSTETGVTVTLTKDLQTVTATETATGVYQADVPNFGTWTVTAVGHGQTVTDTIAIDTVKIYEKTLTFFKASIAVTYPSGATCVCEGVTANTNPYTFTVWAADDYDVVTTMDGVEKTTSVTITTSGQTESVTVEFGTITVNYTSDFEGEDIVCSKSSTTITKVAPVGETSVTFRVPDTGSWTITSEVSGDTYTRTATVSSLSTAVSVSLSVVPDGSTVTPTDDIQTWLACGSITDKSYTLLSEVLADSTTLASLMADNNAVDYLVRSTTWASGITGNALAMHDIGINNYCVDTLIADSTWKTAIQSSSYIKNVYNISVPKMVYYTLPRGEASADSEFTTTPAYLAFDNNDSTAWAGNTRSIASGTIASGHLQYKFEEAVAITLVKVNIPSVYNVTAWAVKGSNDGTNFTTIASGTTKPTTIELVNTTAYQYYRFDVTEVSTDSGQRYMPSVYELQFYGREDIPATITKKTFATATDAEINEMCKWSERGVIDLEDDCGWAVGQTHTTTLGAIAATGTYKGVSWTVGEAQAQQQITFVLSRKGVDELVDPQLKTDGTQRTVVNFRANQVDCLSTKGYMNSTNTNTGSWGASARRQWAQGGYFSALSSALQKACAMIKCITAKTYNGTENETTNDFVILDAEKEIFGTATYSNTTEAGALSQVPYYETSANRVKKLGSSGTAERWWVRSPRASANTSFCAISNAGGADAGSATHNDGIAPVIFF